MLRLATCLLSLAVVVSAGCATPQPWTPQHLTPTEQVMWEDFSAYMNAVNGHPPTEADWNYVQYVRKLSPERRRAFLAQQESDLAMGLTQDPPPPMGFTCMSQRWGWFDTTNCY